MERTKLSVVIAKYNEDVRWLSDFKQLEREYDITLYLYDKSPVPGMIDELKVLFPNIVYVTLDNLGRESYTYLYHTIAQYDSIKNDQGDHYILFTQGRVDDHSGADRTRDPTEASRIRMRYLTDRINDAKQHTISKTSASPEKSYSFFNMRVRMHQGNTTPAEIPFGPWFIKTFGRDPGATIHWVCGAIFCTKASNVLNRSLNFYEQLFQQTHTINPEVGHYLERTWLYIYGPDDINFQQV